MLVTGAVSPHAPRLRQVLLPRMTYSTSVVCSMVQLGETVRLVASLAVMVLQRCGSTSALPVVINTTHPAHWLVVQAFVASISLFRLPALESAAPRSPFRYTVGAPEVEEMTAYCARLYSKNWQVLVLAASLICM